MNTALLSCRVIAITGLDLSGDSPESNNILAPALLNTTRIINHKTYTIKITNTIFKFLDIFIVLICVGFHCIIRFRFITFILVLINKRQGCGIFICLIINQVKKNLCTGKLGSLETQLKLSLMKILTSVYSKSKTLDTWRADWSVETLDSMSCKGMRFSNKRPWKLNIGFGNPD